MGTSCTFTDNKMLKNISYGRLFSAEHDDPRITEQLYLLLFIECVTWSHQPLQAALTGRPVGGK